MWSERWDVRPADNRSGHSHPNAANSRTIFSEMRVHKERTVFSEMRVHKELAHTLHIANARTLVELVCAVTLFLRGEAALDQFNGLQLLDLDVHLRHAVSAFSLSACHSHTAPPCSLWLRLASYTNPLPSWGASDRAAYAGSSVRKQPRVKRTSLASVPKALPSFSLLMSRKDSTPRPGVGGAWRARRVARPARPRHPVQGLPCCFVLIAWRWPGTLLDRGLTAGGAERAERADKMQRSRRSGSAEEF